MRRGLGVMAFLAGVNAFPLVAWCVLGNALGSWRLRQSSDAWARSVGPLEGFGQGLPVHGTNEAARRLEALADGVGIELRIADEIPPGREVQGDDEKRAWREVQEYVERVLEDETAAIEAAPEAVARTVTECRPRVDEIARALLGPERPLWPQDASLALEAKQPNLLGHIQLARLLVASALDAARAGRHDEAERLFVAAWRWWEAVDARPELICQLIAMAELKGILGGVRKLLDPDPSWTARLAALDPVGSYVRACTYDAWCFGAMGRGQTRPQDGTLKLLQTPPCLPYLRLGIAWYEHAMLGQLGSYASQDPCAYVEIPLPEYTKGNMGGIALSEAGPGFLRARKLDVARSLTGLVVAAKVLRARTPDSRFPLEIPFELAPPCRSASWRCAIAEDGTMTIALEPAPGWPATKGAELPLRYVETVDAAS